MEFGVAVAPELEMGGCGLGVLVGDGAVMLEHIYLLLFCCGAGFRFPFLCFCLGLFRDLDQSLFLGGRSSFVRS